MKKYFKVFTLISVLFLSACGGSSSGSNDSNNDSGPIDLSNYDSTAFITTWKTDNSGSSNDDQITILTSTSDQNYTVDWGDGSQSTGVTGEITHTYATTGTYIVVITGDFKNIKFGTGTDSDKLLSVEQWGDTQWSTMGNAFNGCENLVLNATDAPDLSQVTSLGYMFNAAKSVNSDLNHWDVSNITSMGGTFKGASAFNGDVSQWDVSSVTNMSHMFDQARAFNGNLSQWDVSSAEDMSFMFYLTDIFNGDLSLWTVSSVEDMSYMFSNAIVFNNNISTWDVSSVTSMEQMFTNTMAFNNDISGWDVSSVTNMNQMFYNADAFNRDIGSWVTSSLESTKQMFSNADLFDQDIGGWDVSLVTDMYFMFYASELSTANYDALLNGWSSQALQSDVDFHGGHSTYSTAAETARSTLINTYGWSISDGGLQ